MVAFLAWRSLAITSMGLFSDSKHFPESFKLDPKLSRFGYYGSFGAGAILFAFGFFFVLFFFKEPKKLAPSHESKDASGRSVVSLKNVANSFSVLVKEREGGMRHIVVLTYACFAVCRIHSVTVVLMITYF